MENALYRRVFWALAALAVCAFVAWLMRRHVEETVDESDTDLPPPGKRERLVLTEDIRHGLTGCVSYRGSVWSARNEAGRDLKAGEVVFVERVEPTHTLVVTAAGGVVERM